MKYNWQLKNWPDFNYKIATDTVRCLKEVDEDLKRLSAFTQGMSLFQKSENTSFILIDEALNTSAIEGELLSRADVMSSIRYKLNQVSTDQSKDERARGVVEMMISVRDSLKKPLTEAHLFAWHQSLMKPYYRVNAGVWRSHSEPMQVISGTVGKEVVHFEAPPSENVPNEMELFFHWFNGALKNEDIKFSHPIIYSAIAHLYFESIHPFEDGNGRIGRAIAEKAMAEAYGYFLPISLSKAINAHRQRYYDALKEAQCKLNLSSWITYFVQLVKQATEYSISLIKWTIKKAHFFEYFGKQLNDRQQKVLNKMMEKESFEGGMNAKKYMSITRASKATATRDLQQLKEMNALTTSGGGRSVSYQLNFDALDV